MNSSTTRNLHTMESDVVLVSTNATLQAVSPRADASASNVVVTSKSLGGTPRWFRYVERRLNEFETRSDETTSPDAYPKPSAEAISSARAFVLTHLRADTPTPTVLPAADNGVDLVWFKGGWHVELAIRAEGTEIWAHNIGSGILWCGPFSDKLHDFQQFLVDLSGLE